jgi:hypothetical protein
MAQPDRTLNRHRSCFLRVRGGSLLSHLTSRESAKHEDGSTAALDILGRL